MTLSAFDKLLRRLIPAAVAATVASATLGLTACGNSTDNEARSTAESTAQSATDSTKSRSSKPTTSDRDDEPAAGPSLLGDRAQAQAGATTVDDVYDDLQAAVVAGVPANDAGVSDTLAAAARSDGLARVCSLMSEQAKRQTIVYAERAAGLADVKWTCEKATGLLLRRAGQSGDLKRSMRTTVVGVNAKGDRATATVRFGGRKGRLTTIPLVKENGVWKLGAAPGGGG